MELYDVLIGILDFLRDHEVLVIALFLVGAWIGLPIVLTYLNVVKMRSGIKLEPAPQDRNKHRFVALRPFHEWATRNGFEFVSAYSLVLGVKAFLGVWRHQQHPTYFVVIFAGDNKIPSFTTEFSSDHGLDTNGSNLDMLPSSPGNYKQSFTNASLDELFTRHLQAIEYLWRVGQMRFEANPRSLEESMKYGAQRQAAYIRTLPLWPFRSPYWYYIDRRRKAGKSVEEQHTAGLIVLPNEAGFRDFQFVV